MKKTIIERAKAKTRNPSKRVTNFSKALVKGWTPDGEAGGWETKEKSFEPVEEPK
jgi:hypothetical protein